MWLASFYFGGGGGAGGTQPVGSLLAIFKGQPGATFVHDKNVMVRVANRELALSPTDGKPIYVFFKERP